MRRWEDNTKINILTKCEYRLKSSISGKGLITGSCEHGNENSVFMKGREVLQLLGVH
jgi:hypothetical protein